MADDFYTRVARAAGADRNVVKRVLLAAGYTPNDAEILPQLVRALQVCEVVMADHGVMFPGVARDALQRAQSTRTMIIDVPPEGDDAPKS